MSIDSFPSIRAAKWSELAKLQEIRRAAFEPVFAGFRSALGDELYELVQAESDRAQPQILESLLKADSGWQVLVAEERGVVVGFMAMRVDQTSRVGEIGLNAVHPAHAGRGIGTALYRLALSRMKEAGMRAATVATGGDESHEPARRAYRKAGFTAEIPGLWMYRLL